MDSGLGCFPMLFLELQQPCWELEMTNFMSEDQMPKKNRENSTKGVVLADVAEIQLHHLSFCHQPSCSVGYSGLAQTTVRIALTVFSC